MKITNNRSAAEVYSVKNKGASLSPKQKQNVSSKESAATDSINISSEALKFSAIRERISSGFYDKPEVLSTISSKLDDIISNNIKD